MPNTSFAAFAAACLLLASIPAVAAESGHGSIAPDKLTWMPFDKSHPEGLQLAVLHGDPAKAGPFAIRLKIPAGFTIPSHTHSNAEYITVLSGHAQVSWGLKSDVSKGDTLEPGSFFWLNPGDHHVFRASDETIVDLHSTGPFDLVVDK